MLLPPAGTIPPGPAEPQLGQLHWTKKLQKIPSLDFTGAGHVQGRNKDVGKEQGCGNRLQEAWEELLHKENRGGRKVRTEGLFEKMQ